MIEWLETNGLGGWSSSAHNGPHTRRYHGLLVAATKPPTGRMVLLSKLDETIVAGEQRYELSKLSGDFHKQIFPEWLYKAGEVWLKKTIAMVHGENTVVILYEVVKAPGNIGLELSPYVAARGYHSLQQEGPQLYWDVDFANGVFHNRTNGEQDLYIQVPGASYRHQPAWHRGFEYSEERNRGLDYREDLLNHGVLSVWLGQGDRLGIIVSTQDPAGRNAFALYDWEKMRRQKLVAGIDGELAKRLTLAADQFIVQRGENATIIAGYHWFTDWGRDTMISLPGICLSTERYEEARKILLAFAASVSMGMLPNRFQDNDEDPEYNNVDGTLWYFIAIHEYLGATGDQSFILDNILPVLKDIIDWHFRGTRYHIKVDDDGLLYAGEEGQQLTWMDARVGNWVVTPRMGKPVEIQALWYNALKIFAGLLALNNQQHDAALVDLSAEKARDHFNKKFWYAAGGYCYDVVEENDASLRPNQLLAISLPYPLLDEEKAQAVFNIVEEKLYTPVGLRSLDAGDPRYVKIYEGGPLQRDGSYHQGTVWSWLLGPYVDALMTLKKDKRLARQVIGNFLYHLDEAGAGTVSEIYDAEAPHTPRGCIAQAWSVGEILRVIRKYKL